MDTLFLKAACTHTAVLSLNSRYLLMLSKKLNIHATDREEVEGKAKGIDIFHEDW